MIGLGPSCAAGGRRDQEHGGCVEDREVAYVYAVLDADAKPCYVGHSRDAEQRVRMHWKHRRNTRRNRENPGFYGWLQSLASRPQYCVLAVVPYADRYKAERQWTDLLRQSPGIELLNINSGAHLDPDHLARLHAASRTPEAVAQIRASLKGRKPPPWSAEGRARKSAAMKRQWADPEYRARMAAVRRAQTLQRAEAA